VGQAVVGSGDFATSRGYERVGQSSVVEFVFAVESVRAKMRARWVDEEMSETRRSDQEQVQHQLAKAH